MTAMPLAQIEPRVRAAEPADNAGLIALAAACPMEGDIGLCVERAPDFFALNRLEGVRWQVGVVDGGEGIAGCVAVAERHVYLHGRPQRTLYVSDLKVHPNHRGPKPDGTSVADVLGDWAREACRAWGGDDVAIFATVLSGNRSMERRLSGPRGQVRFDVLSVLRTHSIPLHRWHRGARAGYRISCASQGDIDEMMALWARVARRRQFAPAFDADALARFLEAAPDLDIGSYLLARETGGRLAGFLAVWQQDAFKQLRITGYSRRLAAVRMALNAIAPLIGTPALPGAGNFLRQCNAVHVCVPSDKGAVLRALIQHASAELYGSGCAFLNIGLDRQDPLSAAIRGLFAQTTDVLTAVTSPSGHHDVSHFQGLPVHHEIALV